MLNNPPATFVALAHFDLNNGSWEVRGGKGDCINQKHSTALSYKRKRSVKHILIIRLSAMGDVAMSVPVVAALRSAHPDLEISVLTRTAFRDFFRDIPGVTFIEFDPEGRHKGSAGLLRLAGDIRKVGIDCVADFHDVLRTKAVRTILGITGIPSARIDKGRAEKKAMTRRTGKKLVPLQPMAHRYREVLLRLGFRVELPAAPQKRVFPIPPCIAAQTGQKSGIWIGIAPFAKYKGKIYPIPMVDELIGSLAATHQKVFIFGGGEHEKSFAEGMEKRHSNAVSVIGRMRMSQEMDLMSNMDAMITMDSATMHIASLMGTPVVSVWGATHPYAGFYGYGQDPANAVQADMGCRPCSVFGNKPCIFGDYRCMSAITPDMILRKVASVLSSEKS